MRKWVLRDSLLRGLVWLGVFVVLTTEVLSVFHALRPIPLALCWLVLLCGTGHRLSWPVRRGCDKVVLAISTAIAGIAAIIALTALLYPPNSADAMAYHMPRVVYWAQAHSVAFFATPYLNQIMLQPMNEYVMLHVYLLTGGDWFINLIACAAFVACVIGVSAIAAAFGLGARAQAIAALLCATLPNAILQASGAKNDGMLALWLVCAVYFASKRDAKMLGLAAGLALATKGTAYLFLPPILLATVEWNRRVLAWLAAGMVILNGPQYVRNLQLSGLPLGFDSAQADGVYRWRNEHLGVGVLASNVLRNASEQLGARSEAWNSAVFDAAVRAHHLLGLDPNDPNTTWPGVAFAPPVNANHEANANNRWHLLLYAVAAICAMRDRRWAVYAVGLIGAFLLFCSYLKWQPFLARLELPLFVLAAPLGAWALDKLHPEWLALVPCVFFLSGTRLPLLQNWTRPLIYAQGTREERYFNDMSQWNNRASYFDAAAAVKSAGCNVVGIDINGNQLEYPLMVLLRGSYFEHTGVKNPSSRYIDSTATKPCAIVCLDCATDAPQKFGKFGVWVRTP
ncbi:MAG TPA: hypothetical protein VKE70_07975 [Candidatus Solibacter sp.]|nr:hypothetical protein [Candidatus Solibacter sp.]